MLSTTLFALALQASTCACEPPLVMGHRGSGVSNAENPFAENTVASIEQAFVDGAEYAELDVQLTRDGEVVLHHDFALDDTTNLKGCLADYDYASLATADATRGSAAAPASIPLLADVIAAARARGGKLNIEIKVNDDPKTCPVTDVPALVAATLAEIDAAGAADMVMLSSFDFEALALAKKSHAIPVGYLTLEGGAQLLAAAERARAAGFEAVNPIFFTVSEDPETLASLQATGLRIYPWTVDDPKFIRKLFAAGVDGVITDDVAAALAARDAAAPPCTCAQAAKASSTGGCASGAAASLWPAAALLLAMRTLRRRRSRGR